MHDVFLIDLDKKSVYNKSYYKYSDYFFSPFGFTRGSILYPLFFVIYINNLSNYIVSTVKQLGADDILFLIAHNAKTSADELNPHLNANLNAHP